jgi:hypothetical protein
MPEDIWTKLVSLSNELGVSVSSLIARFSLEGLEKGIPKEEYERLQKIRRIDENVQEMAKLTMWGNELRKSGSYAQMALDEMIKGHKTDKKFRIPLPSVCSEDELEASVRLIQHRNKLALETAKLIKEVYPDLGTFHVGMDDKGRYRVLTGDEITPHTITTSLMGTIDVHSETPFTDWLQRQKDIYNYDMFNKVADFHKQIEKDKDKSKKATSTATGTGNISHTPEA